MLRPDRAVRIARPVAASALFVIFSMSCAVYVNAQMSPASVTVTVSTQDGSVLLPGAVVTLTADDGRVLATESSDEQGRARFADLAPGKYFLGGSLEGFTGTRVTVTAQPGRDTP